MFDNSDHWDWKLDPERLTLQLVDHQGALQYAIDLEKCTTPGELLASIARASGKLFLSERAVGTLVRALDELLGIEFTYCSGPHDQAPIDVRETIERVKRENASAVPLLKKPAGSDVRSFQKPPQRST